MKASVLWDVFYDLDSPYFSSLPFQLLLRSFLPLRLGVLGTNLTVLLVNLEARAMVMTPSDAKSKGFTAVGSGSGKKNTTSRGGTMLQQIDRQRLEHL